MKWLLGLLLLISAQSCKQTAVEQKLANTDSVLVQFFDRNGMINNAVSSTETGDIKKLSSYLNGRAVTPVKCGSSGKIQFFSKGKLLLDATYHLIPNECRYFTYTLNEKLLHTGMSDDAAGFLHSISEDAMNKRMEKLTH